MGIESILLGLLGLGILVFFHELGHFIAARGLGIEVEAFSIGMGKILIKKKIGKTEYRLSLIPLGGYCKMKGENFLLSALENPGSDPTPEPGSFYAASPWKRIIVALAGPIFNLILTFSIFTSLALITYPYYGSEPLVKPITTEGIYKQTSQYFPWIREMKNIKLPGELSGILPGDRILKVNGHSVSSFQDFQKLLNKNGLNTLTIQISRKNRVLDISATPMPDPRKGITSGDPVIGLSTIALPLIQSVAPGSDAALADLKSGDLIVEVNSVAVDNVYEVFQLISTTKGIIPIVVKDQSGTMVTKQMIPSGIKTDTSMGLIFSPLYMKPGSSLLSALETGYDETWDLFNKTVKSIGLLFTTFNFSESLSGPIGVVVNTGIIAQNGFSGGFLMGLVGFLNLAAFLSLGLFIMNLLPIPVLDGGTVVLNFIQMFFPKPFKPIVYVRFQQIGLVFILGLLVFTTINDLIRLPY